VAISMSLPSREPRPAYPLGNIIIYTADDIAEY